MQRSVSPGTRQSRLVAARRESVTPYGRALFIEHGQAIADAMDALMVRFVLNPAISGPHYQALPLLLHFSGRGIRPVAAIALTRVLDGISSRRTHRRLALAIGKAIEEEARAGRLARRDADLLRVLVRHEGKAGAISDRALSAVALPAGRWSTTDRFEVGALLLDLVVQAVGLVELVWQSVRGRQTLMVEATEQTKQQIRTTPPDTRAERQTPCISPPEPWAGYQGLVRRRDQRPLDYLDAADPRPLKVVNHIQQQQLWLDPWMVQLQRQAWDANIRGLFRVTRDPAVPSPRPEDNTDRQAWAAWQRQARLAWAEEREHANDRWRIETCISQAEDLCDRPLWFRYELDFRGRLYTSNRVTTHQGPDHDKALIQFTPEPCGGDGADWILRAAAGHWGLGRSSWAERLQWGRDNISRLAAIAEAPLERLELWRDAADPWQFLQLARAAQQWLADPSTPIGAPVRLDQTTSGIGIAAALVRDGRLAREANLTGSTRHDIYLLLAANTVARLRADLEAGTPSQQRHAAQWLELGVDRPLVKGPVMTAIYGGQFRSLFDGLADHIREHTRLSDPAAYERQVVLPARYLAKVLHELIKPELASLFALRDWLKGISAAVVKRQQSLRWTAPSGLTVVIAGRQRPHAPARTLLHGSRGWRTEDSQRRQEEISVLASNRSITANLVHSFDAALCHILICRAAAVGAPLLTNHDCFATVPSKAGWLHQTLHLELRNLYATDWLSEIRNEIASNSGVSGLKLPPVVGTLPPGTIGQNPYCFS